MIEIEREQSSIGIDVERIERAYTEKDATGRTLEQDFGRRQQAGCCRKGIAHLSLVLIAPVLGAFYGISLLLHIESSPLFTILYCTLFVQPLGAAGVAASRRWKHRMLPSPILSEGTMFILSGFCNGEDHLVCAQWLLLILAEMTEMASFITCLMSGIGILLSFGDFFTDNTFLGILCLFISVLPAIAWYYLFQKTCIRLEPILFSFCFFFYHFKYRRRLVRTEADEEEEGSSLCIAADNSEENESTFELTSTDDDTAKKGDERQIV